MSTADGRGYHVLMHLAVDGLVHWGPFDATGRQQLLALSRVEPPADPEAALGAVRGYVAARGPVTETDLSWWTKLPRTVLRRAVTGVGDLRTVSVDGSAAWVVGDLPVAGPGGVTLVPAFDEWNLGYGDRSLVATPAVLDAIVLGGNGVFRPAVLAARLRAAAGTRRLEALAA